MHSFHSPQTTTTTAIYREEEGVGLTFRLATLSARLSLPTLSSSIRRFSYGAWPATSRTMSRTSFTRLDRRCKKWGGGAGRQREREPAAGGR
jgi:hypothetical protein